MLLASGVLLALAIIPGLPTVPFLILGGALGTVGWQKRRKLDTAVATSTDSAEKPAKENIDALLQVDPLNGGSGTRTGEACRRRTELAAAAEDLPLSAKISLRSSAITCRREGER